MPLNMTHSTRDPKLMDMEDQTRHQLSQTASCFRRSESGDVGLHIEAQFWRRMKSICQDNINDIQDVLAQTDPTEQ